MIISTNSSFTLYATPLSTWRRVPLMLSTSKIPILVWPLKLCDSYGRCKTKSMELSRVTELKVNLTLNHDTALSRLASRRMMDRTFPENKTNARQPNHILKPISSILHSNHSKVKIDNNLNRDLINDVKISSSPNKSNSSVESETYVEIGTKESKYTASLEFYTSREEFDRRFYNVSLYLGM